MTLVTPAAIPFGYSPTWNERDKYNVKQAVDTSCPPLKVALIGLGGVAVGRHLPAIRRLRDIGMNVEVVAGADPDANVRSKVEQVNGFRCYQDVKQLLDREKVDAALVLTEPGEGRLQVLSELVLRGIHMFVEKPFLFLGVNRLEESIAHAREIVDAANAKKLIVATGFVKRFSPPYQVAKSLVSEGNLGPLSLIAIKMCQGWSRHILLEGQACHVLHIARWIGGPIRGLQALGVNRYSEPNYPYDNIVVNVAFASGAIGAFYFNSSSPSLKPWERVEIFGERKWLAVEDGYSVTLHESDEGPSKIWSPVVPHTLFMDEEFGGFTGELRNFFDAISGREPLQVGGEDGIEALVLANLIHRSIRERRYLDWPGAEAVKKKV